MVTCINMNTIHYPLTQVKSYFIAPRVSFNWRLHLFKYALNDIIYKTNKYLSEVLFCIKLLVLKGFQCEYARIINNSGKL